MCLKQSSPCLSDEIVCKVDGSFSWRGLLLYSATRNWAYGSLHPCPFGQSECSTKKRRPAIVSSSLYLWGMNCSQCVPQCMSNENISSRTAAPQCAGSLVPINKELWMRSLSTDHRGMDAGSSELPSFSAVAKPTRSWENLQSSSDSKHNHLLNLCRVASRCAGSRLSCCNKLIRGGPRPSDSP